MIARRDSGAVLIVVLVGLLVVASISLLLTTQGAVEADRTGRTTESLEADYVAQAALQHALWQNEALTCGGEFSLPSTALGAHSYLASASGGGSRLRSPVISCGSSRSVSRESPIETT